MNFTPNESVPSHAGPCAAQGSRLVAGLWLAFDRVALCGEAFESAEENAWLPSHERFINSNNCESEKVMRCSTPGALETVVPMRGTEGSNLAPSSGESRAHLPRSASGSSRAIGSSS